MNLASAGISVPDTMSRATRVLVVEDDEDLAQAVALELDHAAYDVRIEHDGPRALLAQTEWAPDVILLDLGLPSLDGVEVCRRMRASTPAPILVVTARGAVEDRVRGLDAGADDYVVKPISLEELLARVRSSVRRSRRRDERDRLRAGDLQLDVSAHTVTLAGEPIELTPREFALLECFMRHQGLALSRSTILAEVWGYDFLGGSNVIDVYVGYLRQKLGASGRAPAIETVRGIGYALRAPP
jgi:DNA-binding response OmpR family regulator